MGFALPAALLRPRCALTAPFHPYPPEARQAVLFSVALSVKPALSEPPRPLAGMLPYGDRTFLPPGELPRPGGRLPVRQARLHYPGSRPEGQAVFGNRETSGGSGVSTISWCIL